jgi:hypothetical protein
MHSDLGSSGYFLEDFLFGVTLIPWTQFRLQFTSGNYDSVCFLGHISHMDHPFMFLTEIILFYPPPPQQKKIKIKSFLKLQQLRLPLLRPPKKKKKKLASSVVLQPW